MACLRGGFEELCSLCYTKSCAMNGWFFLKVRDTDTILATAVPALNDLYRNGVACPGLGRPMLGCVYVERRTPRATSSTRQR